MSEPKPTAPAAYKWGHCSGLTHLYYNDGHQWRSACGRTGSKVIAILDPLKPTRQPERCAACERYARKLTEEPHV